MRKWAKMHRCVCKVVVGGVVVGLSALVQPLSAITQSTLTIPAGTAVTIDGTWQANEWTGRTAGDSLITMNFHEAEGYVQIGLRSPDPLMVASLCIARGDTVEILHASSALGRARYVRAAGDWMLQEGFEWRVRTKDLGAEGQAERAAHRADFGWVASISVIGAPGEVEFQVRSDAWAPDGVRLAMGVMIGDSVGSIRSWPTTQGSDGCGLRAVVAGPLPEQVQFSVAEWLRVERT